MAVQIQVRRGSTAEHSTFTGAVGEITMDTTKNVVVVHNGSIVGGFPLALASGSAITAASLLVNNNLNISTGNAYQINGVSVLNATTLGSGVTTSSLTSVGTLSALTVSGAMALTATTANTLNIGNVTNDQGYANAIGIANGNGILISRNGASNNTNQILKLVRDDSNGNTLNFTGTVGIGTTSPDAGAKLTVSGGILTTGAFSATTGSTGGMDYSGGGLRFFSMGTGGSTKGTFSFLAKGADNSSSTPMSIDASGNVVVGGASVLRSSLLSVHGAIAAENSGVDGTFADAISAVFASNNNEHNVIQTAVSSAGTGSGFRFKASDGGGASTTTTVLDLVRTQTTFYTGGTERARITAGGYFKASDDGTYVNSAGIYHELRNTGNSPALIASAINASMTSVVMELDGNRATTNNTWYFIDCYNNATALYKLRVADSGTVTNGTGTYGTISDERLKQDIVDAGSAWDDLKAVRFRKYRMKSDVEANPDAPAMLGVVAQELEQVMPGLVDEHPDMERVEVPVLDEDGNETGDVTTEQRPTGTSTKSVKSSILLMKAAVALQEAMARIESLEARLDALEN